MGYYLSPALKLLMFFLWKSILERMTFEPELFKGKAIGIAAHRQKQKDACGGSPSNPTRSNFSFFATFYFVLSLPFLS